jgi:NADH:ubiquinone oxidoreductase subunit 2 (subunit N)
MIWEFHPYSIFALAALLMTGIISGARGSLPVTLISGVVLLSSSITVNLLALISLHLVSFLQSALQAKKAALGVTQKAYFIRLLGCFIAIFGMSTEGSTWSPLLMFFGLILSLPLFPLSTGLSRHYHAISSEAYLDTVVTPALVTLVVLWRLKTTVKSDYLQVWDSVVMILGLTTYLMGAVFAAFSKRVRWNLTHLSQSWIGFCLFALVLTSVDESHDLGTVILCSMLLHGVIGFRMLQVSNREPAWVDAMARVFLLGAPLSLGYFVFSKVLVGVVSLNPVWLALLFAVQVIQVFALIQSYSSEHHGSRMGWRFSILLLVQVGLVVGYAL